MKPTPKFAVLKPYYSFIAVALVVANAGLFVACGPSNKMKTLRNDKEGVTEFKDTDGKKRGIPLTKEEADLAAEASLRAQERAGTSATERISKEDKQQVDKMNIGSFEDTDKSASPDVIAPATIDDTQVTTEENEVQKIINETSATAETQMLMDTILDISLADNSNILNVRYKNSTTGKSAKQAFGINTELSTGDKLAFKTATINADSKDALDLNIELDGVPAAGMTVITIVAERKTVGNVAGFKASATALVKENFAKVLGTADELSAQDEFILALSKLNVISKRTHFFTNIGTQEAPILKYLDGGLNKVQIVGKEKTQDAKVLISLKSNFPKTNMLAKLKMVFPTAKIENSASPFYINAEEIKKGDLALNLEATANEDALKADQLIIVANRSKTPSLKMSPVDTSKGSIGSVTTINTGLKSTPIYTQKKATIQLYSPVETEQIEEATTAQEETLNHKNGFEGDDTTPAATTPSAVTKEDAAKIWADSDIVLQQLKVQKQIPAGIRAPSPNIEAPAKGLIFYTFPDILKK